MTRLPCCRRSTETISGGLRQIEKKRDWPRRLLWNRRTPSLSVDDNETLSDRLLRDSPLDIMTPREQGQASSSSPLFFSIASQVNAVRLSGESYWASIGLPLP